MQITIYFQASKGIAEDLQLLLDQLVEQGIEYSLSDVDQKENAAKAAVYDVLAFPAVVAARSDGAPVKTWKHSLPQASEVAASLGHI